MEDFPRDLLDFEARFSTEAACRDYLFQLRWPAGFCCPRCGGRKTWPLSDFLLQCSGCSYQSSVTAGTIFQDTRKPLRLWFRAVWWVTGEKHGASAMGLQRVLGLKSYKTAWTWLHKLRLAMVRPDRSRLTGRVEVDEFTFRFNRRKSHSRGKLFFRLLQQAVAIDPVPYKSIVKCHAAPAVLSGTPRHDGDGRVMGWV